MPGWKEQRFTSPGTWTWPGGITHAEVIVVGGGGGGYVTPTPRMAAGGGGGYRREWWPVSSPVPVTIGAAGTTSFNMNVPGGTGGTTYFGPAGPGPIPLIPASTVAVGGGGGGGRETPSGLSGMPAPSIGGGGGSSGAGTLSAGYGGRYGHRGNHAAGGGASGGPLLFVGTTQQSGSGIMNMGGGGNVLQTTGSVDGGARSDPFGSNTYSATNFGGGGAGSFGAQGGVVIVRWFE